MTHFPDPSGVQRPFLDLAVCWALAAALCVQPAAGADRPITGRVLDDSGAPITGATVEILPQLGRWGRLRHRLDGTEPGVADRTVSGDDGQYELPAQPLGLWTLRVRADGYLPAQRPLVPIAEPGATRPVELRRATETFRVRVVDADGSAVSAAEVDAFVFVPTTDGWQHRTQIRDTADGRGIVELRVPAEAVQVFATARARHDDGERSTWTVSPEASSRSGEGFLDLRLPADPGFRTVRFVRQGAPLPGVAVADVLGPRAIAGDDGVARIQPPGDAGDDLGAATLIFAPGVSLPWPVGLAESPSGPIVIPIDIEVPAAIGLQGRVVTPDGQPIEGAAIFSSGMLWHEPLLEFSARDGVFTLPDRADVGFLRVAADGYRSGTLNPGTRGAEARTLPDVVLEPAADFVAWVVDDTHRPLPDVRVMVLQQQTRSISGDLQWSWDHEKTAISDSEGRVVLHDMAPGSRLLLGLRHDDYAEIDVEAEVPTSDDGSEEPTWILQPGLRVTGRIVDEQGEPLRGVRIVIGERQPARSSRRMRRPPESNPSAESGTDGRFEIPSLAAGTYELQADLAGRGRTGRVVEVRYPGPVEVGDIELVQGVRLKGRVLDLEEQPVVGVSIFAVPTGSLGGSHADDHSATSGPDGRFEFDGLPAGGSLTIFGSDGAHRFDSIQLRPPFPESLTIHVRPQSVVSGRVVGADGAPVPGTELGVHLRQESGAGGSSVHTLPPDGTFEEAGLDAGHLLITAQAPDGRSASFERRIDAGESVEGIEMVLGTGVEVTGRVITSDGEPVVGSRVEAQAAHSDPAFGDFQTSMPRGSPTDASGRYRLAHVRPGATRISVRGDSHAPAHLDVDVSPSGATGIDLVVEARRPLAGVLTDDVGLPVPSAEIEGYGEGLRMRAATDSDGRFELPAQPRQDSPLVVRPPDRPEFHFTEPTRRVADGVLRLVLPQPVATLRVEIFGLDEAEVAATDVYLHSRPDATVGSSLFTKPGPGGLLDIPNLHASTWHVEARSGAQARSGRVEIDPAGGSPSLTLNFGDGIELTGLLIVDGAPLADATARLHGTAAGSPSYSGTTDGAGSFRLSGVEPGRYHLHVDQYQTGLRHVQWLQVAGSEELTLALETSSLSGRVVAAERPRVLLRQGDLVLRPVVEADGTFRLRTALVGAARIEAEGAGGTATADVTLVPGAEIELPELSLGQPDG